MTKPKEGMNKKDLIDLMHQDSKTTKAYCETALNLCIESIIKGLKKHKKITLIGFGTFLVQKRAAREGRNPRTGEKMKIASYSQPSFRAGKRLKDSVNK